MPLEKVASIDLRLRKYYRPTLIQIVKLHLNEFSFFLITIMKKNYG